MRMEGLLLQTLLFFNAIDCEDIVKIKEGATCIVMPWPYIQNDSVFCYLLSPACSVTSITPDPGFDFDGIPTWMQVLVVVGTPSHTGQ